MAYLGARKRTTRQASSQAVNRRRSEGGPRAWFASIDWNSVRFRTVAVLFFVVWGALWVRAGYVQLWEGPFLAERARRQHMAAETVAMPRGMITDRNGHILARSVECCSVYANPSIITDIEATATALAGVLGRPVDQIKPLLEKKRSFVWIARRVDDATAEAIRQADLTGVELSREFERIYPYRQVAGQLLGFVGMDGKGLEGIERSFDEQLGGLSVRQAVRRDASGREFYVNSNYEAQPAEDVHLTLDLQVQSIAEEEISKAVTEFGAKWGGVLVVDVAAGDVLAWAQFPFFNPNSYNQYRPSEYRNRLAQDALEPGSTFKPFLIASALQEGVVTRDTTFNCENGLWKSRYITIRDDSRPKQNIQSVAKILANSSNIGCGKIGLELGAVKYQRYLSRLGFGERTSVQLAESRGILRPAREWSEADLISSSFGQSLSVTVLQMAQAYLTLANEGVYKPLRIVLTDDVGGGDQRIFSKNTTREVLSMMREVVDEGTGKRAAIPGVSVAGKTGTAQKAFRGKYGGERTASFVGLVPAEKPQYLVVIFIDEPSKVKYGGVIAAPVFKSVTSRVMAYHGSLPDPGALTPAQIKAQEKAEARARARAVRRGARKRPCSASTAASWRRRRRRCRFGIRERSRTWWGSPCGGLWKCLPGRGLSLSSRAMVQEWYDKRRNRACVGRGRIRPPRHAFFGFRSRNNGNVSAFVTGIPRGRAGDGVVHRLPQGDPRLCFCGSARQQC